MNKDHIRGAFNQAKGTVKESAGKATGDRKLEIEGKIDKAKGKLGNVVGNMRDKIRRVTR